MHRKINSGFEVDMAIIEIIIKTDPIMYVYLPLVQVILDSNHDNKNDTNNYKNSNKLSNNNRKNIVTRLF